MLEDLEVKSSDLSKEYERILDLEKGAARLKELDNEYNWACVCQVENELAYASKDYSGLKQQCAETEAELDEITQKLATLGSNLK
jgi:chromosome segregation ATPase